MSQNFMDALQKENNMTTTTNGATALKSTDSFLVDLFGSMGSIRKRNASEIESMVIKAFAEDQLLALKMSFYVRNIRGGLGERRAPRLMWKYIATIYPDIMKKNIEHIPFFGRWDDLFELVDTRVEDDMWAFIGQQWNEDCKNLSERKPISLMAKWLKSTNTSCPASVALGKKTAKKLELSEKDYRKSLSAFRKYLNVVEVNMSAQDWASINYSAVPSRAAMIYRKAFKKRDTQRYEAYISSVEKGEEKINAATLYPYDILEQSCGGRFRLKDFKHDRVLEQQWKALPNYVEGENNVLIMADTSASMNGRPMASSVGLAVYFAERNRGVFQDMFITFSSRPSLIKLSGTTLYEKIRCVPEIVDNTNLEAAFQLILNTAVYNHIPQQDMPKSLVIISDMQFDGQLDNADRHDTFYDSMRKKFSAEGYAIPNVIFWNVNSMTKDTFQVTSKWKGVQLASGQSPSTFKTILANIGKTPYEAMVNTLNDPMYDRITL